MENPKVMRLKDGSPTSCGSCKQEVSSVYIILSEKPLTKEIMKTKGLRVNESSSVRIRAFRHKTDDIRGSDFLEESAKHKSRCCLFHGLKSMPLRDSICKSVNYL